eukprot:4582833-Alexandrium_andersonii.AAC.1
MRFPSRRTAEASQFTNGSELDEFLANTKVGLAAIARMTGEGAGCTVTTQVTSGRTQGSKSP